MGSLILDFLCVCSRTVRSQRNCCLRPCECTTIHITNRPALELTSAATRRFDFPARRTFVEVPQMIAAASWLRRLQGQGSPLQLHHMQVPGLSAALQSVLPSTRQECYIGPNKGSYCSDLLSKLQTLGCLHSGVYGKHSLALVQLRETRLI